MQRISHPSTTQVLEFTETLFCGRLAQEDNNSTAPKSSSFFIGLNVNLM